MFVKKIKPENRLKYLFLHLVRIFDSVVVIISLGNFETSFYPDLLFSDWYEE